MKKIINGRLYNTETAKELGKNRHGCAGDFRHYVEVLYLKKTGEFFLYGKGGAMTKYAETCVDGCLTGGEDITPVTREGARVWAEENLSVDEYIEIFGEPQE